MTAETKKSKGFLKAAFPQTIMLPWLKKYSPLPRLFPLTSKLLNVAIFPSTLQVTHM